MIGEGKMDDLPDERPQVRVLMRVDVRHRHADAQDAFELGRELAADVVGIDASDQAPTDARPVAEREAAAAFDERRHLARGEQRRVLADECEMCAEPERRGRAQHVSRVVELARDREHRGRGHDPVEMCTPHGAVDTARQSEVVGGDDQEPGHEASGLGLDAGTPAVIGVTFLRSERRRTISPTMVRMIPSDESVETPRVRGK